MNRLADVIRANPGGLRGPHGPAGAAGTPGAEPGQHWRADEVGFFFPDLHLSYGSSETVMGPGRFGPNLRSWPTLTDVYIKSAWTD
jgi:hypothetical protein